MKLYSNFSLKIIFAGTPIFAAEHLNVLINSHHTVVGVFTKPDKPSGRNKFVLQSPVKKLALTHNIPVYQPTSFLSDTLKIIKNMKADLMVVVAYGLILPKSVLNIPSLGAINIHASLLPRWRGAAPIQYAILSGDKITGITVIKMDTGIDSGDIISKKVCKINFNDTSKTLYDKLSKIGPISMMQAIHKISIGIEETQLQNKNKITYSKKIYKTQGRLNWLLPANYLERCIRSFIPWPISYFYIKENLFKVFKAQVFPNKVNNSKPGEIILANKQGIQVATKNGILNITELQLANKKIMTSKEVLNSKKLWFIPGSIIL